MEYEPVPIISTDFPKIVIPLIDSAVNSIDIVVFDWRFYKNDPANPVSLFNSAIVRAVQRGVVVRCLVQSAPVVDILNSLGCVARQIHSKRILHTKLTIIDKINVIIGSHNYTQNAFANNEEASIYVKLANAKNTLVEYFDNLFGI